MTNPEAAQSSTPPPCEAVATHEDGLRLNAVCVRPKGHSHANGLGDYHGTELDIQTAAGGYYWHDQPSRLPPPSPTHECDGVWIAKRNSENLRRQHESIFATEPAERPELPPLDVTDEERTRIQNMRPMAPRNTLLVLERLACRERQLRETLAALDAANLRVKEMEAALAKTRLYCVDGKQYSAIKAIDEALNPKP